MATMVVVVVDTVDNLRRATEVAWQWVTRHMELLGSGSGGAVCRPRRPAPWHLRRRTSEPSCPPYPIRRWIRRRGRDYHDLPLGRGTGGAIDLAVTTAWTTLVEPYRDLEWV
jgi:hypothetical protein